MNSFNQTLSLTALMITVLISWWFDQQFLTQSFLTSFASHQVTAVSILMAGIFASGRILFYARLSSPENISRSKFMSFLAGLVLLTGISFTVSVSIIAKSLDNPFAPQAVSEGKARVKETFQLKRTEVTEREKNESTAINDRFDLEEQDIRNSYQDLILAKERSLELESGRKYKSGPKKGTSRGPETIRLENELEALIQKRDAEITRLSVQRRQAQNDLMKAYTLKRDALVEDESTALAGVTPESLADTKAARNPFFTSTLKSAASVGLDLTYDQLVVSIALVVAALIELLTFGFTANYIDLRKQATNVEGMLGEAI